MKSTHHLLGYFACIAALFCLISIPSQAHSCVGFQTGGKQGTFSIAPEPFGRNGILLGQVLTTQHQETEQEDVALKRDFCIAMNTIIVTNSIQPKQTHQRTERRQCCAAPISFQQ